MDVRAIILGIVAVTSIVCGTVLAALGEQDQAGLCIALASTTVAYVVGLYSEPLQNRGNAQLIAIDGGNPGSDDEGDTA